MQDFRNLYYLTKVEGLGSVRIKKLLETFGSAENIFSAGIKDITSLDGFSAKRAELILRCAEGLHNNNGVYDRMLEKAAKLGIEALTLTDDEYPSQLKEIYDPPVILYYLSKKGDHPVKSLFGDSIGIVGTRKPSDYGKKMTEVFAKGLSEAGINVISGFARGIDTFAHKAALSSQSINGTVTGAVFGCGIDVIYPPENGRLYNEISEKGILLSEYDIGTFPDSINFPKRNRIISGLSRGIIVIESGKDGGAMITARCALDQGREVFAVPGYVTSKVSEGTNFLIKTSQAKLVQDIDDILVEIGRGSDKNNKYIDLKSENKPMPVYE